MEPMKPSLPLFRPPGKPGGVALVIVLAVLVLLTILVVGFLTRVGMERTAAAAYFESNRNRVLADQAVDIVRAQIDHAAGSEGLAWVSQPGMVRTYGKDRTLVHAYKLYSDDSMIDTGVDPAGAQAALDGWDQSPAMFVDLNAPTTVDGEVHYPILSASALDSEGGAPLIQGFEVQDAPSASVRQPIPMPVRWLYVLEDGRVVAPERDSGTQVKVAGATKKNPIVGRIAFWSDDESSKLNINTAAHGLFWDIPRAFTLDERDRMARFQPALREYQRYPGHPATTSLWPVLGYKVASEAAFDDFVFSLAPRIARGGSEGGTKAAGATPVTLDDDRLYTSVDELLFGTAFETINGKEMRKEQGGLDRADVERTRFFLTARSNSPEINRFNLPRVAIWPINAGSKTPSTLDRLIAFCSTINGAKYYFQRSDATSPTADLQIDATEEDPGRNLQLYTYLNNLLARAFPGFADRSFVDKYTLPEVGQLTTMMLDYIRSSNLYSTAQGATAYTGTGAKPLDTLGSGAGQVAPLRIGDTKGFGRIPALSQAVFQLYVSGIRSEKGMFPSPAYPVQTGRAPYYSERFTDADPIPNPLPGPGTPKVPLVSQSYQSLRRFLDDTGVGKEAELLTSAIIYFDTFDPMVGYTRPRYRFSVDVEFSGSWTVNGKPLHFEDATFDITRDQTAVYNSKTNGWVSTYVGRYFGGPLGPLWMMQNFTYLKGNPANTSGYPATTREYPLASERVAIHIPFKLVDEHAGGGGSQPPKPTLPAAGSLITGYEPGENGETLAVNLVNFSGGKVTAKIRVGTEVVQTYTFDFPAYTKPAPVYAPVGYLVNMPGAPGFSDQDMVLKQFATNVDFRARWANQPFNNKKQLNGGHLNGHSADICDVWLIQDMDTIVALEPKDGDKRIIAALADVPADRFVPNRDYTSILTRSAADFRSEPSGTDRRTRAFAHGERPGRILDIPYGNNAMPDIPSRYPHGVMDTTDGKFWPDFDNGTLHTPDDAYINRADEGSANLAISDDLLGTETGSRSFSWYGENTGSFDNAVFFSPNKQMPSAGMFGSLPTGVVRGKPWQTLLFRPDPGGGTGHPGAKAPADHLLLDLFWMPVVEPYAISEPFSTNGKVNLNYQIMPFGYIHRSAALRGVLQRQEVVVLDNTMAVRGAADSVTGYGKGGSDDEYKKYSYNDLATSLSSISIRKRLNLDPKLGTLRTFENRFADGEVFLSETEIATVPLVPQGAEWSENFEQDYWDTRRLTGDNSREMPYTQLLPRLTTRSNTYTVHFWVESLKQAPSADFGTWDEKRDRVLAQYRGQRMIERYIDPNDTAIPDYAADPDAEATLDRFYRWRVLYNRSFAP